MHATYHCWGPSLLASGAADVASGRGQARDLDQRWNSQVGKRCPVHRHPGTDAAGFTTSTCSLPEAAFAGFQRPEPFIPKSIGHHAEWIQACRTGAPTTCNFGYAGWLTEANHLGNVAYRTGRKLEWDPVRLAATNAPEASRFIRREYRPGWSPS